MWLFEQLLGLLMFVIMLGALALGALLLIALVVG